MSASSAEAELDDEAYDANMQRRVSVDECLPQPDAPAASEGSADTPAAEVAQAPDVRHAASAEGLNGHAAGSNGTANGGAAADDRYTLLRPAGVSSMSEVQLHMLV